MKDFHGVQYAVNVNTLNLFEQQNKFSVKTVKVKPQKQITIFRKNKEKIKRTKALTHSQYHP